MTSFGKRLVPASEAAALLPQSFAARFLLPDKSEHDCVVTGIDPEGATFLLPDPPPSGLRLIAYVEDVGRVEGVTSEREDGGMRVEFLFDEASRPRFMSHLRWLVRREMGQAAAARRHTRFEPNQKQARFTLPGGREYVCEVIDISLSGAGIRSRVRPGVGSPVTLGRMRGRVVRHFDGGFAIEFLTPLERSDLDSALR